MFDVIRKDTKYNEFERIFDKLAEKIINEYEYMVCGRSLRIREIEFYVNHPNHIDLYAYNQKDLHKMGGWYFRNVGKFFSSGCRKGHGLTFGSENHVGGILIRSFEDQGKIIDGCSLCVDYMLELCGKKYPEIYTVSSLKEHKKFSNNIFDPNAPIYLISSKNVNNKIYKGTRVGLGKKLCPSFVNKPYRYIVLPAKVKNGKIGLIQMLLKEGLEFAKIRELTGCLLSTITKIAGQNI